MTNDLDLIRAELRDISDELIARRRPSQPFGVYVNRSDERGAELGRFVERSVFLETFGNTPAEFAVEYDRYEPGSVFITVVDHRRGVPAGVIRVIVPSPAGFKSVDDLASLCGEPSSAVLARVDDAWDLTRVWDFATLAVAPDYRGQAALGLVTQGLLQILARSGTALEVDRYVAILDVPVLRMLQWRIGRPFSAFPGVEPRPYLGSEHSVPVWGARTDWPARLATKLPIMYELLFHGRGLEPVMSTPTIDEMVTVFQSVARADSSARV